MWGRGEGVKEGGPDDRLSAHRLRFLEFFAYFSEFFSTFFPLSSNEIRTSTLIVSTKCPFSHKFRLSSPTNQSGEGTNFDMTETCKEFELCMTNHSALKEFE